MDYQKNYSLLILGLLVLTELCSTEFVPVYMWGTHSTSDPIPALNKISQSSFKDDISKKLRNNPKLIIFAEESLSPEDFGQRDRSGNIAYPNLSKVRKTSKATYLSYVQNPIKATKHASEDVSEISIERLNENFEIPESRVLIINLNDATENERRFDMLKRHDEFIVSAYDKILKKYDNVLALYTAHHASWIGSGEVHSRKSRALLADEAESKPNQLFQNNTMYFYTSADANVTDGTTVTSVPVTYTTEIISNTSLTLTGTGQISNVTGLKVDFLFTRSVAGYWFLESVYIESGPKNFTQVVNDTIYAPLGFSYACGDQTFTNSSLSLSVKFPQFQVQPVLFKDTYWTNLVKFDDPYNCVGFTTIPIWSGLFVTFILLLIMTFGLTMMMDIKTMDRFDDAKGKTITINTSE